MSVRPPRRGQLLQDDVTVGEWIRYVGTFDDTRTIIYKNGVERLDETSGAVARDAKGSHDGAYQGGVMLGAANWPNP